MNISVAILGAGPVAAFVKSACEERNVRDIEIYAKESTKAPQGAFWLRELPHSIESKYTKHEILIIPLGTREDYIKKQWGDEIDEAYRSSFPDEPVSSYGYNSKVVWADLWGKDRPIIYKDIIYDDQIYEISKLYDFLFLTFPTFKSMKENAKYFHTSPTVMYPYDSVLPNNTVYYNGLSNNTVARVSILFGCICYEYTRSHVFEDPYHIRGNRVKMVPDLHPHTPKWNPKDVPNSNVFLIGRFAEWDRSLLSHSAYGKTLDILEQGY